MLRGALLLRWCSRRCRPLMWQGVGSTSGREQVGLRATWCSSIFLGAFRSIVPVLQSYISHVSTLVDHQCNGIRAIWCSSILVGAFRSIVPILL